jgi:hypothetical protein
MCKQTQTKAHTICDTGLGNNPNRCIPGRTSWKLAAVTLDDTQYHLCMAVSDMEGMPQLKEKCIAIRLQLIIGINQLRAILASIQEELRKELAKWLRYMSDLHMHSISVLNPGSTVKDKAGSTLDQIRVYQGIDEVDLLEAVNQVK